MSDISKFNPRKRTNVMIPDYVFGALIFVFVEIMFYSALLSSFFVMRRGRDSWGQSDARLLPVLPEGFNGIVLALSAISILLALRAGSSEPARARGHLLRATGLGILFSAYQIVLGCKLYAAGVSLNSSVFAGCLYVILGSHLLQAIFGSFWIGKFLFDMGKGAHATFGALKGLAVFWCFLGAIWPLIYVELFL